MADEKVKVRLKPGHGTRVTLWGACRPGETIEVPADKAALLNRGLFEIVGGDAKAAAKAATKSTRTTRGEG